MKVTVQLFGPLAERAGRSRLQVTVSEATVAAVLAALPDLKIDPSVKFAVNAEYADRGARIGEGDVVSLLPPVGGG